MHRKASFAIFQIFQNGYFKMLFLIHATLEGINIFSFSKKQIKARILLFLFLFLKGMWVTIPEEMIYVWREVIFKNLKKNKVNVKKASQLILNVFIWSGKPLSVPTKFFH